MRCRGFSLVEVAISLGIFAFCLLAVMGLFASGLKTEQSSQEEEGASTVLSTLSVALENAYPNTNFAGTYSALPPLSTWNWNPATGGTTNGTFGEYAYWVRIKQGNAAGDARLMTARLEVAWPTNSVQWDNEGHASSVKGTASSSIFFFLK